MYHTKQKNGGYFYARQGLPHGDLLRLSREDGDKVESNSIASQRAICEDYIARHDDLELVCEPFVDDGYSGVSFNRPNFKKLEDAIPQRRD